MYEKGIGKIGVCTQCCDNFEGVLRVFLPQSGRVFTRFHNLGQNVDSSENFGDKVAAEMVGFSG